MALRIPTDEEINWAYAAISREIEATIGGQSVIGVELAKLAVTSGILRDVTRRMLTVNAGLLGVPQTRATEALIVGALIYGLHMGLQIGEARNAKPEGPLPS